MKASMNWEGDFRFKGTTESGFDIMIDGDLQQGPRPMELMLLSVASCSSYDVVKILQKARQNVQHCRTDVSAERADSTPSVFTQIHLHFIVSGQQLKTSHVERAVRLSAEQYCSASIMLEKGGVAMTHSFEIIEL